MAGWRIEGQYMETCNCNFLCPCIGSNLAAQPSEGDCKAAIAMRIDKGQKDSVKLDGLSFIVLLHSPKAMAEGNITVGLIVDGALPTSRSRRSAPLPPARPAARWLPWDRWSARSPGSRSGRFASRRTDLCLGKCHNPVQFFMTHWRPGAAGALRMGIAQGAYCVGCCTGSARQRS